MRSDDSSQPLQWHYTVFDDRNFEIRGKTLFFVVVVFSVLLVLTLLFLYARWACRYRNVSPATHINPPPATKGLDATAIKGLPVIPHRRKSSEEIGECCICLGVLEEGESVKVLPRCFHCYHPHCLDTWLVSHPSCPLCRDSLRPDPVLPKIVVVH